MMTGGTPHDQTETSTWLSVTDPHGINRLALRPSQGSAQSLFMQTSNAGWVIVIHLYHMTTYYYHYDYYC